MTTFYGYINNEEGRAVRDERSGPKMRPPFALFKKLIILKHGVMLFIQ
jgi:hypothetical protein